MPESLLTVAYLFASVLFILSLGGLSTQESARRGNLYGVAAWPSPSSPRSCTPA
jgi:NAD(P) transhydrogenase subunit beta